MSRLNNFLETAINCADEDRIIDIEKLKNSFPENSKGYVSSYLCLMRKKGMAERLSFNKWKIILKEKDLIKSSDKDEKKEFKKKILVLTPEEKKAFDLLIEVKIKCPKNNNNPRFAEIGVQEIFYKEKILEKNWYSLRDKLLELGIIERIGNGKGGSIFDLNQDLLLEYMVEESLIKLTLWKEKEIKDKINKSISDFKKSAQEIFNIQENIKNMKEELSLVSKKKEEIEKKIKDLEKKLKFDFPDKEKIISFQHLFENVEHSQIMDFIKNLIED